MFSQTDSPPRLRGITWSTVSPGLPVPQYWQIQPSRASTALRVMRRRWTSRGTRTKVTSRITSGDELNPRNGLGDLALDLRAIPPV